MPADGWRTTCTRCDVHLCEACELLGRHAWGAEHVRLRKMGAPAVPSPVPVTPPGPFPTATFMMHATSGRVGFNDATPFAPNPFPLRDSSGRIISNDGFNAAMLHFTSGRNGFAPTPPVQPNMFAMAHLTSGRAGFAPVLPPGGTPAFSVPQHSPASNAFGFPQGGAGAAPPS